MTNPPKPMLVLPARITHEEAPACLQTLSDTLRAGADAVRVDASGLRSFDSSALAVLLALRRTALLAGRSFQVCGLPQRLQTLAALYGVDALLPQ